LNQNSRFVLYILIFFALAFFRYQLDKDYPYISSDGQIKYYQTTGYLQKGFLNFECIYLAKDLDPDFQYFPINYPWAVFPKNKDPKCIFQYPPFFSYLGTILGYFAPLRYVLYIPLVFYIIIIFLLDKILSSKAVSSKSNFTFLVCFFFASSFPLLTVMDYSEISLFHSLNLVGFFCFLGYFKEFKLKTVPFLAGLFWGLAFAIRTEIFLGLFCFFTIFFLFQYQNIIKNFTFFLKILAGFFLITCFFVLFNYISSGEILGYRFASQLDNQKSQMGILEHLKLAKAYLWGDEYMRGIIQYSPTILLSFGFFIPSLYKKISLSTKIFLLSGISFLLLASSLVTVYGGVGLFGLRYLEIGFIFLLLGMGLGWLEIKIYLQTFVRILLALIFLYGIYFSWKNTKEGLKLLSNASKDYAKLQKLFESVGKEGYVIHDSLYNSYLLGNSFLYQKHINLYNEQACKKILENLPKGTPLLFVQSPPNPYISLDIPKKLFFRYPTNFQCSQEFYEKEFETEIQKMKIIKGKKK